MIFDKSGLKILIDTVNHEAHCDEKWNTWLTASVKAPHVIGTYF